MPFSSYMYWSFAVSARKSKRSYVSIMYFLTFALMSSAVRPVSFSFMSLSSYHVNWNSGKDADENKKRQPNISSCSLTSLSSLSLLLSCVQYITQEGSRQEGICKFVNYTFFSPLSEGGGPRSGRGSPLQSRPICRTNLPRVRPRIPFLQHTTKNVVNFSIASPRLRYVCASSQEKRNDCPAATS